AVNFIGWSHTDRFRDTTPATCSLVRLSGAICSARLHLYRPFLLPIMRSTKMHRRMPAMAYDTVLYDIADRICTITLNRPEKLNAWTRQTHFDLKDAMQKAGADPDVRAIILTGAGRGFCAGADMGGLQAIGAGATADRSTTASADLPGGSTLAEFRMNYAYFPAIPKFIIAAINGPAAGLGFVIPLYADLRFAAESAVFTTAFAQRGLIAEHG